MSEVNRVDLLQDATEEGPLWEAQAWHVWRGTYKGVGAMLLIGGPTRRPPRDVVIDGETVRYVRSFAHEPTRAEQDEILDASG